MTEIPGQMSILDELLYQDYRQCVVFGLGREFTSISPDFTLFQERINQALDKLDRAQRGHGIPQDYFYGSDDG